MMSRGPGGGGGSGGKICINFQNGSCTYGAKCKFVHPGQQTQASGGGGGFQGGGFQGGGQGGGFQGRQNTGGQSQRQSGNFPQRRHGPRPQNDILCNFYIQGNCQRGDTCSNIHQYSLDFDIDGKLFETSNKVQGAISMDIYDFDISQGTIIALVCTTQLVYLTLLPNGQAQEVTKIDGITAMNYDRNNKLLFIAYNNKNKGHIKIFKDNGSGDIKEVVTSHDLHQKDITAIQTQMINNNMIIITGGKDDHVKAWNITNEGKFECVASGISTTAIYSLIFANDNVIAGCENGKVEVFKIGGDGKEFIREKEFEIYPPQPNSQGGVYKLIYADDVVYAPSFCSVNNQLSGKVGLISVSGSGKVSHLASLDAYSGAITMEYITASDVLFIGYPDGNIQFMDKEGFIEKGRARVHKAPIRDMKQLNESCLVMDENGIFSFWRILDEKTAGENRSAYQSKRQASGGFGGGSFGGGGMSGGMSGGMGGGFGMNNIGGGMM